MWCASLSLSLFSSVKRLPHRWRKTTKIITYRRKENLLHSLDRRCCFIVLARTRGDVCTWRLYNLKIPPKTMLLLISVHEKKRSEEEERFENEGKKFLDKNTWAFFPFFPSSFSSTEGLKKKYKRLTEKHQECALMLCSCTYLASPILPLLSTSAFFFILYALIMKRIKFLSGCRHFNVNTMHRGIVDSFTIFFGNRRQTLPWKIFSPLYHSFLLFQSFHFISFHHQ